MQMGTIVWLKTIRIEIRSREGGHIGRPHCHAVASGKNASIDLLSFEVLEVSGFSRSDVKEIVTKIKEYQEELLAKWEEYHDKI
jgi:hypothetical protein